MGVLGYMPDSVSKSQYNRNSEHLQSNSRMKQALNKAASWSIVTVVVQWCSGGLCCQFTAPGALVVP